LFLLTDSDGAGNRVSYQREQSIKEVKEESDV